MTEAVARQRVTGPGPVTAPPRPDGRPYQYELIYDGGRWRAYADDFRSLMGELIDGYVEMTDDAERARARSEYAVRIQVVSQARLNAEHPLDQCTPEQEAVLMGTRDTPPVVETWTAPVPLVLVSTFYQPHAETPAPVAEAPGHILWIDPTDDRSLLLSLHHLGVVVVAERESPTPSAASQ
jgi:hypothetical protein